MTTRVDPGAALLDGAERRDDLAVLRDGLLDDDESTSRAERRERVGELRDHAIAEGDPDRQLRMERRHRAHGAILTDRARARRVLSVGRDGRLLATPFLRVASRFVDECLEQALVLFHLGMPQDGDGEALVRVLEALERPVVRPRGLDEALPHAPDTLVVARLDAVVPVADDLGEPRPLLHLDSVLGERAERRSVAVVPDVVRKVLDEVAAAGDVEQLEPAADRERRDVALERPGQERQLARVAVRLRGIGAGVARRPVRRRVDVDPTGEDDPVENIERLVDAVGARRTSNALPPARSTDST